MTLNWGVAMTNNLKRGELRLYLTRSNFNFLLSIRDKLKIDVGFFFSNVPELKARKGKPHAIIVKGKDYSME